MRTRVNPLERFWAKVQKTEGCWSWLGKKMPNGYGTFWTGEKYDLPHRFSYEVFNDEKIPIKLVIDHLCRNRICVNPKHMEVVSRGENVLRGVGLTAQNARKTHCIRGHELTKDNIYEYKNKYNQVNQRICKTCRKLYKNVI